MSEPRYEKVAHELRSTAPPAPDGLRERVRALREPQPRRVLRLRPALQWAGAVAVVLAVGTAAIAGIRSSSSPEQRNAARVLQPAKTGHEAGALAGSSRNPRPEAQWDATRSGTVLRLAPLTPGSRLQHYDISMSLRVRDLSRSTQTAVRQTRGLGGYVAAANYATGGNTGDSTLDLRVPVQHVQQAIAKFTDLGTILSQRISVGDLQAPLDRTDARIAAAQKIIAELQGKTPLTPTEQMHLDEAKRTLKRLSQSRAGLVREGTYAKIALQLTTRKTAAKHVAPGRFDSFWGDASDILGKEAIAVLYALVVAGPFAILAALALLAERARRRRADHRLLGETG